MIIIINDFNIDWKGDEENTVKEIFKSLIYKKLDSGIPVTIALIGHSRVGKSVFALKIQDFMYEEMGVDFVDILEDCVLIKPDHYAKKTKAILEGKTPLLKKARSLQMDEAKFLLDSGDWQKLKNKAIRTIAATSATIKPILFIVVAQMLSDIDPKTRRSIDILFKIKRSPGKAPIVNTYTFYEKITDIDKVYIKPRTVKGVINYPNGRTVQYTPNFRPSLPRKEVLEKYISFEQEDKRGEIFALLEQIEQESNKISGKNVVKLQEFAEHLVLNPDELSRVGDFNKSRKTWKFSKDARSRYNYDSKEFKMIEQFIQDKLVENKKKQGVVV